MTTQKEQVLYVLSDDEIADQEFYDQFWIAAKELRAVLPRRQWPDKGYKAVLNFQGTLKHLDETPYVLPTEEELFGNDVDLRWLDNCFLKIKEDGTRRTPYIQTYERIRFIDLFFQIVFPVSIASSYR